MIRRSSALGITVILALAGAAMAGEGRPATQPVAMPKSITLDLGDKASMPLVLIPPGKFTMGSPKEEKDRQPDEAAHQVTISKPFYIGTYPVTQEQWKAVMGSEPKWWVDHQPNPPQKNLPAYLVTWDEAVAFCGAMSRKTMRTVRLPTEAEWEYACRAGTETAYSFGDDPAALADHGWYRRNSKAADGEGIAIRPVGQKKPNAWGLYDMHGNVYQFCRDWYAEDYFFQGDKVDPQGPATGQGRVKRGGSIESNERDCRSAARHHHGDSKTADGCTGLRVVVTGRPIIGLGLSDSDIDEILPKIDAIQMKAVEVRIDSAYVGKKLQGSVKVRNVGPDWDFGPMVFAPTVSVRICDENDTLLTKSGGGWGGGMKTGQEMNVHFQGGDRAGHFGTMFLFEKVGKYKATIEVHPPGLAKKVLSSVTIPFDVEPNEAARTPEAAAPSEPRIIYSAGAGPVMVSRNPNSASATTQPAVRIRPPASGPDSGGVYDPKAVKLKLVSLETKPASVGEIVSASGVVRNIGPSFPNPGLSPSRCPCYQARIYDPDGKLVFRGMFAWTVGLRANEEDTIKFDSRANVLPTGARPFVIPKAGRYKLTVDIGVGMGNVMDSRTLTIDVAAE